MYSGDQTSETGPHVSSRKLLYHYHLCHLQVIVAKETESHFMTRQRSQIKTFQKLLHLNLLVHCHLKATPSQIRKFLNKK